MNLLVNNEDMLDAHYLLLEQDINFTTTELGDSTIIYVRNKQDQFKFNLVWGQSLEFYEDMWERQRGIYR